MIIVVIVCILSNLLFWIPFSSDIIRLGEARSIDRGGVWNVETGEATAMANIRGGRKGGSLGRMVDAQIVLVPFFAMCLEPAFGDRANKTAAGSQIQMLGRGMS